MRAILSFVLLTRVLSGQAAETPAFEVASIKPNRSGDRSNYFNSQNGRINATNVSLRVYIREAFELKEYQLSGPPWLDSERFDIVAKAASPVGYSELRKMLRTLLVERFGLTTHTEMQELPVYALVVAKNGPKIQPVENDGYSNTKGDRGRLIAEKVSMARLAQNLMRQMDRPVIEMTGMEGVYSFTLEWDPEETRNPAGPDANKAVTFDTVSGPTLFAALQQQLGLRLDPRKGPVQVLVVDHVERQPSEN